MKRVFEKCQTCGKKGVHRPADAYDRWHKVCRYCKETVPVDYDKFLKELAIGKKYVLLVDLRPLIRGDVLIYRGDGYNYKFFCETDEKHHYLPMEAIRGTPHGFPYMEYYDPLVLMPESEVTALDRVNLATSVSIPTYCHFGEGSVPSQKSILHRNKRWRPACGTNSRYGVDDYTDEHLDGFDLCKRCFVGDA